MTTVVREGETTPLQQGHRRLPRSGARPTGVPASPVILLVFDEDGWQSSLHTALSDEGYRVVVDPTGDLALRPGSPLVDVAVVDVDGAGGPRSIDALWRRSRVAILAMSSSDDEATVLGAFEAGADQFVTKDVSPRYLVACVRSLLRRVPSRSEPADDPLLPVVEIDDERKVAVLQGEPMVLSVQEFEVLRALVQRAGKVVPRAELAAALTAKGRSIRSPDFVIRRLREKLTAAGAGRRISAVRGVGFRFEVDGVIDLVERAIDLDAPLGSDLTDGTVDGELGCR